MCQSLLMMTLPEWGTPEDASWGAFIRWVKSLGGVEGFITNLIAFDPRGVAIGSVEKALDYLQMNCLVPGSMRGGVGGDAAIRLCSWIWLAAEEAIAAWERGVGCGEVAVGSSSLSVLTQADFLAILDEQRLKATASRDIAISRLAQRTAPRGARQRPRSAMV